MNLIDTNESNYNSVNLDIEDKAFVLQNYIRLILCFIVFFNFALIILLKFFLKRKEKRLNIVKDLFTNVISCVNKNIKIKESDNNNNNNNNNTLSIKKSILFIIAHPDDEIMFFYPTIKSLNNIISLLNSNKNTQFNDLIKNSSYLKSTNSKDLNIDIDIHLLCLTKGNANNLGEQREEELKQSLSNLNISNFKIIDSNKFKDSINTKLYNSDDVSQAIDSYIKSSSIKCLENLYAFFTFDENGVTKHNNHISCYLGLV